MSDHATYLISQGLLIKGIGLIYLIAFVSLKVQVGGLYGKRGIQPIHAYLQRVRSKAISWNMYYQVPTLFWLNDSDNTLHLACWAGIGFSCLVIAGIVPAVFLLLLWILYRSFCVVGSPFLQFQWDILLLEAGFLALLLALQTPPPFLFVFLLWFLLFRFMFSSGLTKLLFGSKEWKDLTAMDYHYETQPLPTKLGYYLHHQSRFFSRLSTIGVYFFELIVPLFIFTPPKVRLFAFFFLVFFQLLILISGSYAFFNWLTIVLCIPLLPDTYLKGFEQVAAFTPLFSRDRLTVSLFLNAAAVLFLFLNIIELLRIVVNVEKMYRIAIPFRRWNLLHPYGLFVHMTTVRDEIIIEGSNDQKSWKAYEFRWKPGSLFRPPKCVAPHQPRLDWQMWFAALTHYQHNPWIIQLMHRLLEGSQEVLALLETNPFSESAPRYIRAKVYRYHFSDLKTKRKKKQWWTREFIGEYCPTLEGRHSGIQKYTEQD